MRPLIGLTTYREQAKWGVWDQPADLLPVMYADAIVRAGGVPVLLPPATEDPDAAPPAFDPLLERLRHSLPRAPMPGSIDSGATQQEHGRNSRDLEHSQHRMFFIRRRHE